MQPLAYHRAATEGAALALAANHPDAAFIAGGTDLLQLFKQGPAAPAQLIDISRLPLDRIEPRPDTLHIGALARLADVARHPEVRRTWPALAEAIEASASPQVRNLDCRRQPAAAHPLRLLPQPRPALQQAPARFR